MTPRKMLRCKACGRLIPVNKSECPYCGAVNDNVQNVQEEQPVVHKPVEAPVAKQPVEVKVAEPAFAAPPAAEPIAPASSTSASSTSASPEPEPIRTEGTVASSKSRKPIILAALAALLLVVGIVLYLCMGTKKKAEDEVQTTDTVSVGVADAVEAVPMAEPESIDMNIAEIEEEPVVSHAEAMCNAYEQILRKAMRKYYNEGYCLMDVTHDGEPELIAKTGNCEADYKINIYTFVNGEAKKINSTSGGHSDLFNNGGRLVCYFGHMGYYNIRELRYNGKVSWVTLDEGEIGPEEVYPEHQGRYIELTDFEDLSALKRALGM